MTRTRRLVGAGFLLLTFAIGVIGWRTLQHGFSARDEPLAAEAFVARQVRRLAIPSVAREKTNPLSVTPQVIASGLEHYADHCAMCHGNDGRGRTAIGQNLYPKAPDMRLAATQNMTDGELFYVIENGIRLTGMPAWGDGTSASESASWALVHFIRRIPNLRPEDIARMEALNPKSPDAWREEEETRRFLEGAAEAPTPSAASPHHD